MKICGLLSWYDESPSWLGAAVTGMAQVCDEIVAVDGAYALFPSARPRSFPQQAEAIMIAAEAANVGCNIYRPREIFWGNEVQKRQLCMDLAGVLLDEDDWVIVWDADMHLMKCDPGIVRYELANTDCVVATVTTVDCIDYMADEKLADKAKHVDLDTEWTHQHRLAYRWHPTIEYGPGHWHVSRLDSKGKEIWLWGPNDIHMLEETCDLGAALVVYHRSEDRAMIRRQMADAYYKTREAFKVEAPKLT